jgi:ribokinase
LAGFDVIVCGSLHLDIIVTTRLLPRLDETAVGHTWKKVCGGKGGNQAVHAAQAGARTAMIGCIGDDDFGLTLIENLMQASVEVSCVQTDRALGSGMSVAILQDDGDYGAVIVSGANTAIDVASMSHFWSSLGEARVLVLQNEVPHAVNVAAAQIAHKAGAIVVFNAAPARTLTPDLLDLVDVLIVNRVEAEALFGCAITDRASVRNALMARARYKQSVIVTLGGEGVVVAGIDNGIVEIAPIPVTVTSTHGAGDCFAGVFAAQLAAGRPLIEACRTANDRAADYVSRLP